MMDIGALSLTPSGPVKTLRPSVARWATSDLVNPYYCTELDQSEVQC